jgi:hypothetical protein
MSDLSPDERPALRIWETSMAYAYTPHIETISTRDADIEATHERLEAISRVLDSAFVVPGTRVRVGADALLNLVPGLGPLVSKGISGYLIYEARRLGVPTGTLLRMVGNVGVDFVIGAIPILGWVGDVFHRANLKNMRLLRAHLARERAGRGPVIDMTAR